MTSLKLAISLVRWLVLVILRYAVVQHQGNSQPNYVDEHQEAGRPVDFPDEICQPDGGRQQREDQVEAGSPSALSEEHDGPQEIQSQVQGKGEIYDLLPRLGIRAPARPGQDEVDDGPDDQEHPVRRLPGEPTEISILAGAERRCHERGAQQACSQAGQEIRPSGCHLSGVYFRKPPEI